MGNNLCNDVPDHDASLPERNMASNPRAKILRDNSNPAYASSDNSKIPKGLYNLTNTCYMSSILQVLFVILPEQLSSSRGRMTELFFELKRTRSKSDYRRFKDELEK